MFIQYASFNNFDLKDKITAEFKALLKGIHADQANSIEIVRFDYLKPDPATAKLPRVVIKTT